MKSASLILSTGLFAGISATTYDSWQPCTATNEVANSWNSLTARYSYRYKRSGDGPTTQKRCCPGHTGSDCSPCAAGTFSAGFDTDETGASLCLECPAGEFSVPGAAACFAIEAADTGSDEASFQMKRDPVNAQTGAPTPAHDWDTTTHGGEPVAGFSQTGGSLDYDNSGVLTAGNGHHAHHAEIAGTNSMTSTGANSTGKYFKTGEHGVLGREHNHASYDDQKATYEQITDATQAPTKAPTIMVSGVHAKYCLNGNVFVTEGWVGACPGEDYCRNCQCVRTWGAKSVVNVPGVTQGYLGVTTQTSTVNPVQNSELGKHSDGVDVYAPNQDGADYSRPLANIKCGTAYKPQPTCKHITCSFVNHTADHTGRVVPKGTDADADCTDPEGCGALDDAAARSTKTVKVTHHNHVNEACQLLDRFYAGNYTYPVGLSGERKKKEDDAACAQVDADLKNHRCGFNKFSGDCTCECTGEAEQLWQTYNHWHADNHSATHMQYGRRGDYTAIHKHAAPLTDFNLTGVSPDGFHQDAHGVTRDVHAHAENFDASKITEDTSGHDYEQTRQDYHGTQSVGA